ncbi:hypothetical protein T7987_12375 [Sulfitobacter faviae]|uniref:Uncharacterized protein n=1 Tax=Sulfitobacter faviae TaxID=1775881 RepID=A0ABZ0UXY6_9RHOB|nr:hypothetical protein [Sulfitobacter faviae]WPZ20969.1 hypothetical protein T7987_12375 [Sulfitobacter faviae]
MVDPVRAIRRPRQTEAAGEPAAAGACASRAGGTAFQPGSAAVGSATVMSALVFLLTGSPVSVGAVSTNLRFGWLLPQLL